MFVCCQATLLTFKIDYRSKQAALDTGSASFNGRHASCTNICNWEIEVHFCFENPTDQRNRILSGLVPRVSEHSTHISQHLIPIHCKTVFRDFNEKLNSKLPASFNSLGHYSAAGETAWICCRST